MGRYEAVMFDWVLTLAHYPDRRAHLRRALEQLGRPVVDTDLDQLVDVLVEVAGHPDHVAAWATEDCSPELHRSVNRLVYDEAGFDDELAETMYELLGDPTFLAVYPGVADLLHELDEAGIAVAVVSDIHVDLRHHAVLAGIDPYVDHWILSFEHGIQKPDPAIFQLALDALGSDPAATLMVGDRASHDGVAATLGIDTLILPARADASEASRFDPVRALLLG